MYNLIIERVFLNIIIFVSMLQKRFILFFSSHFNIKQPLCLKKMLLYNYYTFEFSEIVTEFREIVKAGVKMCKYSNIKLLE